MRLKKFILNCKKWLYYKRKPAFYVVILLAILLAGFKFTQIENVYCYIDGQTFEDADCHAARKLVSNSLLGLNRKKIVNTLSATGKYQKIIIRTENLNTVVVDFHSVVDFFIFNSAISKEKLELSMEKTPLSSESAGFFLKPSLEIGDWMKNIQLISLKVFPNGYYETMSTTSSQIYVITQEKKDSNWYMSAHKLIKTVLTYTDVSGVYFLDNNVYFAQDGRPDIIISTDYEEQKLLKSLQSLGFLTTIKKDPKIIDLRYTNPIIR